MVLVARGRADMGEVDGNRKNKGSVMGDGLTASQRHSASVFSAACAEIERLRRLVPERADFHLANWGRWRRNGVIAIGYPDHVPGLENCIGRCVAEDASDHDYEDNDAHAAEVCDAIIDGLPLQYRMAFSNVYESSVWRFRSTAILEQSLVDGAAMFWMDAKRRGLT